MDDKLKNILEKVVLSVPEIEALALVSVDGLPIKSVLPNGMNEDRVAAMGAALISLCERIAQDLKKTDLVQVVVQTDNGYVVGLPVAETAILVAFIKKGASLKFDFSRLKGAFV